MDRFLIKNRGSACNTASSSSRCTVALKRKEKQREYDDSKRCRGWDEKWKCDRPWLQYNECEDEMYCSWCRKYVANYPRANKSAFINGTNNWKASTLVEHNKTELHKRAGEIHAAKQKQQDNSVDGDISAGNRALNALNFEARGQLSSLFRAAHAIAKNSRPYRDFTWQLDLLQSCGAQVGTRYRNEKQAAAFCHSIAEVTRRPLREAANSCKFLSIMCDGSTDVSVVEEEVCYLRMVTDGVVDVKLLGMQGVIRPNAGNIRQAIEDSVTDYGNISLEEFYSKLVALGSDGASVMLGSKGGVAALLREKQPALQAIHCVAHRLELAYKDTLKAIPLFVKVDTLLLNIYLLYKHSAPMRSGLHESYKAFVRKCQIPTRVGGTRWMPHTVKAIGIIMNNYDVFTEHLSQVAINGSNDQKAKSKGMLLLLRSPIVIKFFHLLWDILLLLQRLSLKVQENKTSVSEVHSCLTFSVQQLEKFHKSPGAKLLSVTGLHDGDVFMGQKLISQTGRGPQEDFHSTQEKLLTNLFMYLDKRFADTTAHVIQATSIADLKAWPSSESEQDNSEYGDDALSTLSRHYHTVLEDAGVDTDQLDMEWNSLKIYISKHGSPASLTWKYINQCHRHDHSNILALIDLCLTLPASSAECERGFSLMKQIKTDWRSKLKSSSLTDLMTIVMYSPDISQFDPTPSLDHWLHNEGSDRRRRPEEESYMQQESESEPEDSANATANLLNLTE